MNKLNGDFFVFIFLVTGRETHFVCTVHVGWIKYNLNFWWQLNQNITHGYLRKIFLRSKHNLNENGAKRVPL